MPDEKNRAVKAVTKLIKLTQAGDLEWEPMYASDAGLKGRAVGDSFVYAAEHLDRMLRLYRSVPDTEWGEPPIVLEIVSFDMNLLWRFPYIEALEDLYQAVMYQTANVEGYLEDLLDE